MKSAGLTIATLALLVLSGVIWWSNKKEAAGPKLDANAPPKILSLDQSAVTSLSIQHGDQPPLTLAKNSDAWRITSPASLAADSSEVSSLVSTLSSLSSAHLIEDRASDLASYGLAYPNLTLTVTLKDSKTQKLLIGDQTPNGNAYYVMLAGDPRLFTIASYNKTSLDKSANDLRDKRLLTADFDKVSQIELTNQKAGKKQQITFGRNKDSWQVLKPSPGRASSDQVEELIRSLRDAKMDLTAATDDAKTAAAFKSASPFASAKLTGTSGTQELEIHKAKDDYYAKSSAVSGIYKIPSSSTSGLDKSLDDFRNKKLFDFGYQEPSKIEIHDGAVSYFFTHSGSDWWDTDGKKLDESTIDSLVEKLRSLTASKFADSGFASHTLQLLVTSSDGKSTDRVSIAKHADSYIAKRENEPALYELSAKDVQALQDSAKSVKPFVAPAPPPKK